MRFGRVFLVALILLFAIGCGSRSQVGFEAGRGNLDPSTSGLPLPSSMAERDYEKLLYQFLQSREYVKLGWRHDKGIRDTGPYQNGTYFGTHPAVRIYYSPEVIEWLLDGRQGEIPNGSMIVKEMFEPPAVRYAGKEEETVPKQWTVMVRDTEGSHDGWFWSYYASGQQPDKDEYPFNYPDSGFGVYCVRCHGSALSQLTFVSTNNIAGFPGKPLVYTVDDSWMTDTTIDPVAHPNDVNDPVLTRRLQQALAEGTINQEFLDYFKQFPAQTRSQIQSLPPVTEDRVVAKAHREMVSSDQCMSCHSGDTSPFGPNMLKDGVDISPWGEWRWSMMGLAGRDPIFFAQLETEVAVHSGKDFSSETIQNTCLVCHGVMGQREYNRAHSGESFTIDRVLQNNEDDPENFMGGLARDGVSCAVCHQIGDQSEFPIFQIDTGKFFLEDPVDGVLQMYGQYTEPTAQPMLESLGTQPRYGAHVKDSLLCASCHLVKLPVLDTAGEVMDHKYEQATFFEWQNSQFAAKGGTFKSCQDCHMPQTFHGTDPLKFKIANIQDQDFPETEGSAAHKNIEVLPRGDFSRHELSGINVFGLEFFRQYPQILGVRTKSFMTGLENGLDNSVANSLETAARSATLEILSSNLNAGVVETKVKVTNLAGHRFPSGVGFRRLFVEFVVKDGSGLVIWGSGRSNDLGLITDASGKPLASETHETLPGGGQAYEPHHQVVDSEDQAQVYGELIRGSDGTFNTTFLGRAEEVKDNRLLPKGWTAAGPAEMDPDFVETTEPVGEAANDPDFTDGTGSDTVTYRAGLPSGATGPFTVEARLYYQAIPPGYLKDRFDQADGAATRRLHYMASRLQTGQTSFPGWKLPVASAGRGVTP